MAAPHISPTITSPFFLSAPFFGSEAKRFSSKDLLFVGRLVVFAQFHQTMMMAWENFRENQSRIRGRAESIERSRGIRTREDEAVRLEGQRRRFVAEGDAPMHANRPYIGQRRFHNETHIHEGSYIDHGSRHLNLPI